MIIGIASIVIALASIGVSVYTVMLSRKIRKLREQPSRPIVHVDGTLTRQTVDELRKELRRAMRMGAHPSAPCARCGATGKIHNIHY